MWMGDWWSPDLVSLIRIVVQNIRPLEGGSHLLSAGSRWFFGLRHRLRRNTVAGSRRNIAAHYDLSNDFFRLFLDREMLYSSAIFESEAESLEDAQIRKLDHICHKLELGPEDHVLEIGTGWGAFAARAASRCGCRVTTTTISRQQHAAAAARIAQMGGAGERIELLLEDYRNLKGRYDKIVSIEMFEAVGLDHYDDFFSACDGLLAPQGSMLMQAITMNEQRFKQYHRRSDWIQRRIFPGGRTGVGERNPEIGGARDDCDAGARGGYRDALRVDSGGVAAAVSGRSRGGFEPQLRCAFR
jgi:cyclopropane-fatty-acyl-phospholipid synthase